MYSKNTLALNQVTPYKAKSIYKYSQLFISLLQPTTNQITPLAFTLETKHTGLLVN